MKTYFSAKAVAYRSELRNAKFLFQMLDGIYDDGVDILHGMGVLPVATAGKPLLEVEVRWAVNRDGVTVEEVNDQTRVAIGGELVSHELAVDPDAEDVR